MGEKRALRPRVLFISGRELSYMRNRVLIQALGAHFDVAPFTSGAPSTTARIGLGLARFLARRPSYDVCFAGFYAQPLAVALSVLQKKPILFDAYVSTYDTLCEDRRRFSPRSPAGRLAYWLDQRSCLVSHHIITDTQANARYFAGTFGVPLEKITPIYVGCDESLFYPHEEATTRSGRIEVFYYGAFLPLHGVEVIVRAAALLSDHPQIHFTIGGDGVLRTSVEKLIAQTYLKNIDLVGWIATDRLPDYISNASICLGGHFSAVPKAARVISTKTFQFIAMRKPAVVADNPATKELFTHGKDVYAVPANDPPALARAILTLAKDRELRHHIADNSRQLFEQQLTTHAISGQLATLVEQAHSLSTY
jgi:glycosyltransferase involved in cell wall biosynthesis